MHADTDARSIPPPTTHASFAHIYATYAKFMKAVAISKFHLPPEDADELVHDIFATYLGQPAGDIQSLKAYLLVSICRAARRRHDSRRRSDEQFATITTSDLDLPDDAAEKSILLRLAITDTLLSCDPRCRDLLYRNAVLGESPKEIADDRGTTAQYVRELLSSCRRQLRARRSQLRE
jgi:RNA polymerase sigma factor (sigma-70 family)